MDDIRDITSGSNSEQTGGNSQQTASNQYRPYGQQGQYGRYGQYGQIPDPREDLIQTFPEKKKKSALPAILVIIALLTVIVIGLVTFAAPYMMARKFGKALAKDNDIDTILEMVFPEGYIEKSGIDYNMYSESISQALSSIKCYGEVKYTGVKIGKKIKSGDLKDIEKYYDYICKAADMRTNVRIQKGYEVDIKFKLDGDKSTCKCCVVKMKGEGWKVFPLPIDELNYIIRLIEMAESMNLEY